MSLRDGVLSSKQSPVTKGDCFAKCARNDMQTASLPVLRSSGRELPPQTGEELRPPFGRTRMPSILDKALKGKS